MILIIVYNEDTYIYSGGIEVGTILLLYASTTGNTELIAEAIADELLYLKHEVEMKSFDFDRIDVEEVLDYDAVLIGTHTWDDGELPYEVEDFYDDLGDVDITGCIFGVFGSADSFYRTYGGAVDLIADHAKNLGAEVLPNRLKIELAPDNEDIVLCQRFAAMVSEKINQV